MKYKCVFLCFSITVHFRYVVFHPFLDEVLVGKIKYCSQEGVYGEIIQQKKPSLALPSSLLLSFSSAVRPPGQLCLLCLREFSLLENSRLLHQLNQ